MMAAETDTSTPLTPSSDYLAMLPFWQMVNAILGGAEAMRAIRWHGTPGPVTPYNNLAQLDRINMASAGSMSSTGIASQMWASPYLPRFPNENWIDYEMRRRYAPFTDIYGDISRNLASKPFSKTMELGEDSGEDLKKLSDNIDGQGNSLHVVSANVFKAGVDKGIVWILVDYTRVPAGSTLAAERDLGARPYWVEIAPERMLCVRSSFLNGAELITHARIEEACTEQTANGYGEIQIVRVREFNREPVVDADGKVIGYGAATWALYQEVETAEGKDGTGTRGTEWQLVDGGPITIGVIPLVPFVTGRRHNPTWRIDPPLCGLAHMQVEEFQQESNLKTIKELTAFPMLCGHGVDQGMDQNGNLISVPVGPRAVLFAPMNAVGTHGAWTFIEPAGSSLTFLETSLEKLRSEMRTLGMQPLTEAQLTVITAANVAQKAHSAVQAWTIQLKDALEQAWKLTCLWLGQSGVEPIVKVHTDFDVDFESGRTELPALIAAEAASILSKRTVQDEFKRRGVLSDDFDPDEEEQRLAEQQQGLQPEQPIDPRTGRPLVVAAGVGAGLPVPLMNGQRPPLQ